MATMPLRLKLVRNTSLGSLRFPSAPARACYPWIRQTNSAQTSLLQSSLLHGRIIATTGNTTICVC
eukprot:9610155-Alexandrium_andersonii.AAC.1